MSGIAVELALRFGGAAAGAVLALVFVPPRSTSGFARRVAAAMIAGPGFAGTVRGWGFPADGEGLFSAACVTAFASWWIMGAIRRAAETWQPPQPPQAPVRSDADEER